MALVKRSALAGRRTGQGRLAEAQDAPTEAAQPKPARAPHTHLDLAVDKDVVEGLSEPLVRLLRNALDHGVEPPEERRARRKSERAVLRLSARASGDRAIIELADDGRGFDLDRIRAARSRSAPFAAVEEIAVTRQHLFQ
jgi:hypothetical protein